MSRQQVALDKAIELYQHYGLRVKELDVYLYQTGVVYFEEEKHGILHENECICYCFFVIKIGEKCVIIHNNWVIGSIGKLYRIKEMGYYVDPLQQYYKVTPSDQFIEFVFSHQFTERMLLRMI